MTEETKIPETPKKISKGLAIVLGVFFVVAISLAAYLTYTFSRDFFTTFNMTELSGIALSESTPQPDQADPGQVSEVDVPLQPVGGPAAESWDGAKRVSILVMGLDYRDWAADSGAPRTDSMILLSVDPLSRTAGMMSIPRDLWVNIPGGYDYGRINTAYQLGEVYSYPDGGGPGLAMDTVEELLGVPIDYYAQIDFSAFVDFINELGGIEVDIPKKIKVDPLGDNNSRTLKKGKQLLNGKLALAYARARYTEGADFDRAQRQQQVIMAVRDRILNLKMLPSLITKSGRLYRKFSSGIRTNLTLDEVVRLAWLASQVPEENIKQGVIGPPDQVLLVTSQSGDQVLKPITDKIRLLRDEIFTNSGPASPAAANQDISSLIKEEGARVAVMNGSYTAGLAAETSDYLKSQGLNVVQTDNASQVTPYTEITFYNGKPYTVKFLVELMRIDPIRVFHVNDPNSQVDVSITLGDDWANNNPMP